MPKFEKTAVVRPLVTEFWCTCDLFDTVQQRVGTQLRVKLIKYDFFWKI
jgi:hypothetical protein